MHAKLFLKPVRSLTSVSAKVCDKILLKWAKLAMVSVVQRNGHFREGFLLSELVIFSHMGGYDHLKYVYSF